MKFRSGFGFALAALCLGSAADATSAAAVTVPAATFYGLARAGDGSTGESSSFSGAPGSVGATFYSSAEDTAAVSATGDQHLVAQAHTFADVDNPAVYADAGGSMGYSFAITGPANVLVPLLLTGKLTTSSAVSVQGSYGLAEASFSLDGQNEVTSGSALQSSRCASGLEATCNNAFTIGFDAYAFSTPTNGNMMNVYMGASASARAFSGTFGDSTQPTSGSAQVFAYADPFIEIDPDWAASHPGYAIQFSQGVVNDVSPVPELGEWAMMTAGLSVVGAAARRRKA